jgi:hypothetical protein
MTNSAVNTTCDPVSDPVLATAGIYGPITAAWVTKSVRERTA